jgi:translocation and assembly module TamA
MQYSQRRDSSESDFLCPYVFFFFVLLAGIFLSTPASAKAELRVPYEVSIEGITDRKLLAQIEAVSDLVGMKDKPPASLRLLQRRATRDIDRFFQLLKAQSYYRAQVNVHIDSKAQPVLVIYRVDTGPPYLLKSVDLNYTDRKTAPGIKLPEIQEIGLYLHKPIKARTVIDAQEKLLLRLKAQGFPFARVVERKVIVDHGDQRIAIVFPIDPGPQAQFGHTTITGLTSVDEKLVREKIPWREGDLYSADLLAEVRKRLTDTGLFATVRVAPEQTLDDKGGLPVTIVTRERKHRSIRGGISYKTDEGPGATISWEHRNLFHRGERLGFAAGVSDIMWAAEGGFRKPNFLRDDQSLHLSLRLAEDRPDAYTSRSFKSTALIERALSTQMKLGGGLAFKTSKVEQMGDEQRYRLLSIPLHLDWDTSDDFLNPTRGGRLAIQCAPTYNTLEPRFGFVKGKVSLTRYQGLLQEPLLLLAGRAAAGFMPGAGHQSVPADERFYAGGGGSIRGYAYQSVGPIEGETPLGGRSILELSLELRVKLTETFGIVGFIDGGSAFKSAFPDFAEHTLWGTGLGIRYFTPIGPLRLDVGIPLNRRENIDDSFQLYVSLGQAF